MPTLAALASILRATINLLALLLDALEALAAFLDNAKQIYAQFLALGQQWHAGVWAAWSALLQQQWQWEQIVKNQIHSQIQFNCSCSL